MDIQWLEDFLILRETGNFTQSAARLNISQAAFSRRIQSLEAWLNQTLVDRSRHPVRFTREGEVFHQEAFEILNRLSQARSALEDPDLGARNHVDVLMPHILSASRFSRWWQQWSDGTNLTVSASVGNITEMVSRFIAGGADLLICHSGEDLPMILDSAQYKSRLLELDRLSPYMALKLRRQFEMNFPGTHSHPVPLVRYSQGAYFARLVDQIVSGAPGRLFGRTVVETDMSTVVMQCLRDGFGIGWLPDRSVEAAASSGLYRLTDPGWSMDMSIHAYMSINSNNPACHMVWKRITGENGT